MVQPRPPTPLQEPARGAERVTGCWGILGERQRSGNGYDNIITTSQALEVNIYKDETHLGNCRIHLRIMWEVCTYFMEIGIARFT